MKPEDLFIGAWVQPKNVNAPFQVCSIDSELVCDAADSSWCLDEIGPILITPEILEKLRFKKDTGEECWACRIGWLTPHHYNKKYIPTSWEVQICVRNNSFSGVIKYVHQLQAALKLCGAKKKIIL